MDHEDRPEGRLPSHTGLRQHLEYFRFVIAGVVYQFRVLPFGLSTAPREFTKTLAPVLQLLRTQGVRVHAYLDDLIMLANSQNGVWNIHNKFFNFYSLWVEQSTQTRQCYNPHTFWTFWFYISTWNEPLFLLRTLTSSPMSYPVCLHQRSCLADCKISSISRMSHFAPFLHSGRLHLCFFQFWFKAKWSHHQ